MDRFATKDNSERLMVFQETANSRGVTPTIIEKDFWVCWTLKRLYESQDLGPYLTFKGGTSLSKAYGLIERFSEDIDLTISREAPYVQDGASPMEADISGKERRRRIEALRENAQRFVEFIALPKLIEAVQAALGHTNGWEVVLDERDPDKQTILFRYPKTLEYNAAAFPLRFPVTFGYIQPQIKLEFGARGEIEPNENKTIRPYVAESYLQLFTEDTVQVSTLAVERSFWEKVTILHSLCHGSTQRDRMSRHYYDTYMMAESGVAERALGNVELLERVVQNKSLLFKDPKASYDTAVIGSLRLVPDDKLLIELKKDYQAMSEMFMGEATRFEVVISKLKELEIRINQPGS